MTFVMNSRGKDVLIANGRFFVEKKARGKVYLFKKSWEKRQLEDENRLYGRKLFHNIIWFNVCVCTYAMVLKKKQVSFIHRTSIYYNFTYDCLEWITKPVSCLYLSLQLCIYIDK